MAIKNKLNTRNVNNYFEKIRYLETCLGKSASFKILDPEPFYCSNIDLNEYAKKIAEFIHFKCKNLLVYVAKQDKNTGGNYSEENGFYYIEIAPEIAENYYSLGAVLVHEIMHRYLYANNMVYGEEQENEILTDISTIYTGLGNLP